MLTGHQTWVFDKKPIIRGAATVVGPEEGNGPIADDFDIIHGDMMLGQKRWEKGKHMLLEEAAKLAIENAEITPDQLQYYIASDLLNQITSSSFTARTLSVPYIGVFSACSTSME